MEQVGFVERLPLLLSAAQEILCRGAEVADVVHQDVDARIINGHSGFSHGGHDVAVADVANDNRAAPSCLDDRVMGGRRRVGIDVGKHHVRTGCRQPPADAATDTQRAASDDRNLAGELHFDRVLLVDVADVTLGGHQLTFVVVGVLFRHRAVPSNAPFSSQRHTSTP
jgi:hypothetical protein